jgi:hypothetical protein
MNVSSDRIVCYDAETYAWLRPCNAGDEMPPRIRAKYSPYVRELIPAGWNWTTNSGFAGAPTDQTGRPGIQAAFFLVAKIAGPDNGVGQITLTLWMMTLEETADVVSNLM